MSDEQFECHALEVLGRELGADGLHVFCVCTVPEPGDYTKDRMQWQKELTIQEVLDSIKQRRHAVSCVETVSKPHLFGASGVAI